LLIYDHNKEFIAIDDEGLRQFGFNSLDELLGQCDDFANLFVKKPGYIHNFKNFKWIDFILHAEAEESRAIVNANGKSFECRLSVEPFYLVANPSEEAYKVILSHVHVLGEVVQNAPESAPTPPPAAPKAPKPATPEPTIPAALPDFESVEPQELKEPEPLDIPDEIDLTVPDKPETATEPAEALEPEPTIEPEPFNAPPAPSSLPDFDKPLDIDDVYLPTQRDEPVTAPEPMPEPVISEPEETSKPMLGDYIHINHEEQEYIENLKTDREYLYDPQIAADELGLPVDLIEEFIGDFIQQSYEFKEELFASAAADDFENVKILSHKLKGVAANLRIEDAFEVLSIINTTGNHTELEANLKHFYYIVGKLDPDSETPVESFDHGSAAAAAEPQQPAEPEFAAAAEERVVPDIPTFEEPPAAYPEPQSASQSSVQEDDLYSTDLLKSADDTPTEPAVTEPTAAPSEDDIYDFGLKTESEPSAIETPEPAPTAVDEVPIQSMPDFVEPDLASTSQPEELSGSEDVTEPVDPHAHLDPLHYDINRAGSELGIDAGFMQELVNDFVSEALVKRHPIEQAALSGDDVTWHDLAMPLKGISDNLRISEVSDTLEALIHTQDSTEAKRLSAQLYHYIEQLENH